MIWTLEEGAPSARSRILFDDRSRPSRIALIVRSRTGRAGHRRKAVADHAWRARRGAMARDADRFGPSRKHRRCLRLARKLGFEARISPGLSSSLNSISAAANRCGTSAGGCRRARRLNRRGGTLATSRMRLRCRGIAGTPPRSAELVQSWRKPNTPMTARLVLLRCAPDGIGQLRRCSLLDSHRASSGRSRCVALWSLA